MNAPPALHGHGIEAIQAPSHGRSLPQDQVDLSVLTNPAPQENFAPPTMIGERELPRQAPPLNSSIHSAPPKEDRVDFNAIFTNAPCADNGDESCAPKQYYQPAVPLCMPIQPCPPPRPCTYCGPILGVPPTSFEGYYQSPACYRTLWATHATERAHHCSKHHTHLQGCCGCEQH